MLLSELLRGRPFGFDLCLDFGAMVAEDTHRSHSNIL